MWEGTVVSINIAQEAAATMQSIVEVRAIPGRGLEGDRYFAGTGYYSKTSSHGGREVTLIEIEAIEALFRGVLNAAGGRLGIKVSVGTPDATLRPRVSHRIISSTVNFSSVGCSCAARAFASRASIWRS